jgi:hypothetical protein
VASAVLMQPDDVTVLDDAGKICGELSRDQVAAILFDTETTSAGA